MWLKCRSIGGTAGGRMAKPDGGDFMESLECWLERFVLIPQRYLEAAPSMLFILKREFQTPGLNIFYLCIISLLRKSLFFLFFL